MLQDKDGRPNVIVFGMGHSGTSIVTRMLHTLGWCKGDADDEFSESVSVRAVNEAAISGRFCHEAARRAIEALPKPWAVKDPRFVHTIGRWHPVFTDCAPVLVWLFRNPKSVAASYERRNEQLWFDLSVDDACQLAGEAFALWPWAKLRVEFEDVREAVRLFDIHRAES